MTITAPKIIIVAYSFTGNNDWLARLLQKKLKCDLEEIKETGHRWAISILLDLIFHREARIKACKAEIGEYDLVILVSPVWDAKVATPMATFVARENNHIHHYAFVSLCGGREGQQSRLVNQLTQLAGKSPVAVGQLKVNDVLPPEQRNNIRYTTPYRVKEQDQQWFEKMADDFILQIGKLNEERTKDLITQS